MEYIIEKLVDGKWYYEGRGPIEYVNRIGRHFSERGIIFRQREVEKDED